MKKAIWVLTIILVLIVSIARPTPLTKAWENAPCLAINSPYPSSIKIYQNTAVPLEVQANVLAGNPDIIYILYSLDGKANITLTNLTKIDGVWFDPNRGGCVFWVNVTLQNLAEGNHTLNVYSYDAAWRERSASVEFTVDKDYQLPPHDYPRIVFLSPLNQTYTKNELPLTFTVDGQIVNAYCLLSNLNLSRYTKAVTFPFLETPL